jgi:hypothetical protein
MSVTYTEKRQCPPEFQERLTRRFGVNRFGQPNFKIEWAQSLFVVRGNVWRDKRGNEREGYKECYQTFPNPGWVILRWKEPQFYGSPELYYAQTYLATRVASEDPTRPYDSTRGYYAAGEYPWTGRYEALYTLNSKEVVNGKLEVSFFPLCHFMIDTLIPMIVQFEHLSQQEKMAVRQAVQAAEEKKKTEEIADILEAGMPSFWGPVSFTGQGCRTSLLTRKMDQIERQWNALMNRGMKPMFSRGMAQGDRPEPINYV